MQEAIIPARQAKCQSMRKTRIEAAMKFVAFSRRMLLSIALPVLRRLKKINSTQALLCAFQILF